jgi:hypothetical protein
MTLAERLEAIYPMLMGAALAFWFCSYVWDVEGAKDAVFLTTVGWLVCLFWARNLRRKARLA